MPRSRSDRSSRPDPRRPASSAARAQAQAAFEQGVRNHMRGAAEAAESAYRTAISLDACFPEPHNNLGALLADRGETAAALELVERAVELQPEYAEALHNVGLLNAKLGRFREASVGFRKAVARSPEQAGWWNDLGNAHLELFEFEEALEAYDRAEALDPSMIEAVGNRANALRGLRRPQEALEACDRALRIDPTYAHAASNKGLLLKEGHLYEAAIEALTDALRLNPGSPPILTNLAVVYMEMTELEKAKAVVREALRSDPEYVDALNVLGNCAMEEGDYVGAMECYRAAAAIRPDDCNANWNQSLIHLLWGEFEQGWAKFGWRTQLHSALFDRHRDPTPEWDGSPLGGRSILLYAEQGLGDSIQFVRYAKLLKARGAGEVTIDCPALVAPLLDRVEGVDRVVPRGEALPPHDLHSYLLSLPGLLGTREGNIPADVPYLPVEPRAVMRMVEEEEGVLKVGIVWAGGAAHQRDRIRSAGLDRFRALFTIPGVRFYSLQKGPPEAELRAEDGVVNLSPHLHDLLDTAAAISKLDLVISVDTSVAHLAGGLGCRTWVLLPSTPDWRWMLEREDTPWYPSMRLFRQPAVGEWGPVFGGVAEALRALAPAGAPAARKTLAFHHPSARAAAPVESKPQTAPELEFCRFLREALVPGDLFIDYSPGAGAASLAAATAAGAPVIPVLMIEPDATAAAGWRERAAGYGLQNVLTVLDTPAAQLSGLEALATTRCFLRVGTTGGAEELLRAASALVDRSLAAVLWPACEDLTEERIGRLLPGDFRHCSLALRDGELSVDPMSDAGSTDARVSIAGWFLAGLTEPAAAPAEPAAKPDGRMPLSLPPGARAGVGIDWMIGTSTGWGTYGANLALELAARGEVFPVLLGGADPNLLSPIARHLLAPAFSHAARSHSPRLKYAADFAVLRGLGNELRGIDPERIRASRDIGLVFLEDTHLSPEALERGREFDRIVAGSSWNGEVLRGYGLDNVSVSLQGIDTTVFRPGPRSGRLRDRFVVYSGGKLEYRKGQDIVIAAFREFRERHPEALLLFAWHNFWPTNMEEITFGGHVQGIPSVAETGQIDFSSWLLRNGLQAGSFVDLGVVPNAQMGQLLREADAAVFTNRCEGGTNLVAMEAMACGVPTILSANSGHLDLVHPARCYPLLAQGQVNQSRHCRGVDGWGESSVEEVVAALESIHADSREAAARAGAGATFMEGLSWSNQVAHLLGSISDLIRD